MKNRPIAMILALVLIMLFMASCGENQFKYDNATGEVINLQNGAKYLVDYSYQAKSRSTEPYATIPMNAGLETRLYTVGDEDPGQFLADENANLYYSSDIKLPTLSEMNSNAVRVCEGAAYRFVRANITEKSDIEALVEAYVSGRSITYPAIAAETQFCLKFESAGHSAFFYNILYLEYAEDVYGINENGERQSYGKRFLFNRFEERFVPIGDTVAKYITE